MRSPRENVRGRRGNGLKEQKHLKVLQENRSPSKGGKGEAERTEKSQQGEVSLQNGAQCQMRLRVHKEMDWKVPTRFCSRANVEMLLKEYWGWKGREKVRTVTSLPGILVLRGEEI